jgi:hypothetical protein
VADAKSGKPAPRAGLNFTLELRCSCKPPICPHAGPGIAKLLTAAYARGRSDGARDALQGVAKAAAKVGVKVEIKPAATPARKGRGIGVSSVTSKASGASGTGGRRVGVRQAGSRRTQ